MTCRTCDSEKARANGECHTCDNYRKRTGKERPERLILRRNWRTLERLGYR